MKKIIKWGALALVLIIVLAIAIVYLKLNAIVKYAIESQGTQQMKLKTELNSASVGLFGGELGLNDLKIANPAGFSAPQLFTLDGLSVKLPVSELRDNPKHISKIELNKPKMVIERSADGKFNFKTAIDSMPKSDTPNQPAGDEMKLIIDELLIKDAVVVVRPGINIPGIAQEYTLPIPTVSMKNIGNSDNAKNGAALRDVAQQVITVLAANASNSDLLPEQLRGLLSLDVNQVVAELGNRLGKEAQARIAAAVPGEMGKQLSAIVGDPNALKDPSKAVEALKANIGAQINDKIPTSNPSDLLKDPGKSVEGLGGLLGNKKDKKKSKSE